MVNLLNVQTSSVIVIDIVCDEDLISVQEVPFADVAGGVSVSSIPSQLISRPWPWLPTRCKLDLGA